MSDKKREENRVPRTSDTRPNKTPTSAPNENQRSQGRPTPPRPDRGAKDAAIKAVKKSYDPITKKPGS
jgi:hypothetical protein